MSAAGPIAVANAPCSFGAFELTVGVDPLIPQPIELLDAVADAGYAGIDLGPLGYLGSPAELPERLRARGLALAGGYFEIAFSDPGAIDEALIRLDELLDTFDATGAGAIPPRPTLADAGSPARRSRPGRAQQDRTIGWDDAGWRTFADGLARVAERCRARGYEPTFHPHTATYVEAPWEIDRLLELSTVGVCLDTGHLLLAGGDPVAAVADWGARINHVHLKDARMSVVEQIVADAAPVEAIWRRRAFCRLGTGDVPIDAVLEALRAARFAGWLVVEQDFIPAPEDDPGEAVRDQQANRAYLRERGL